MDITALFNLSYGVYVVTAWNQGEATGCVVNSAMQITATNPTVAISMNRDNFTHGCITETGFFAINVLSEDTDPVIIGKFGYQSGKNFKKFESTDWSVKGNLPVLSSAQSFIACRVIDKMETSTHTVFLGKVVDCQSLTDKTPMTYSYYHKVIKGKAPKNAPTYIEE